MNLWSRPRSWNPSLPDGPDPVQAVIGWRVWRVDARYRLRSALRDEPWEPRRPLVAACDAGHRAPEECCTCGVYAVHSAEDAAAYLVGRNSPEAVHRVLGRVALWGRVVECEHGWRAERAYPAQLWVPDCGWAGSIAGKAGDARPASRGACGAPGGFEIAFELGRYGVPVEIVAARWPADVVLAALAA